MADDRDARKAVLHLIITRAKALEEKAGACITQLETGIGAPPADLCDLSAAADVLRFVHESLT